MGRLASLGVCMVALAAYSIHTGTEHAVFTAAGDYGTTVEAAATLDLVNRSSARFHLALGDLAYKNQPEARWCDWVANRVGSAFPFMLIPGNHEDDFGEDGHITRFGECLPDRLGVTGTYPSEYLFDYEGLVRVIVSREMLSAAFVPATDTSDFADRFVIRRALSVPQGCRGVGCQHQRRSK